MEIYNDSWKLEKTTKCPHCGRMQYIKNLDYYKMNYYCPDCYGVFTRANRCSIIKIGVQSMPTSFRGRAVFVARSFCSEGIEEDHEYGE